MSLDTTIADSLRAHPDLLAPYTRDDGTQGHWVDAPLDEVVAIITAALSQPVPHPPCPQLGRLRCTRTDAHDPNAVGGHTYQSSSGSDVPDRHDATSGGEH